MEIVKDLEFLTLYESIGNHVPQNEEIGKEEDG
jgi:hypothetical protein